LNWSALFLISTLVLSPLSVTQLFPPSGQLTSSGIVLPRLGLPSFVLPNSDLNVTLQGSFSSSAVTVDIRPSFDYSINGSSELYRLIIEGVTQSGQFTVVTTKVPRSLPLVMYDLLVTASTPSGIKLMVEQHSVVVRGPFAAPFKVFWFSDPHIDLLQQQQYNFWTLIWRTNFLKPDLVVITGDVVQSPTEEVFNLAKSLMLQLEVPVLLMPGNHDHSGVAPYFSYYLSPFNGAWRYGPLLIAYLDTGDGGIAGVISDDEVSWLDSTLKANGDAAVKIVGLHHPMYDVSSPSNLTVDRVYDVMKAEGVSLVINGHMHEDMYFNGPVFTLVNPNSYPGGRPYSGFRFLTVYNDRVDYLQNGGINSFNLDDFTVTYTQLNNGSTHGERVYASNNLPVTISGLLTVRLAKGPSQALFVGASPSTINDCGTYSLFTIPLTLQPHQSVEIDGSTVAADSTPQFLQVSSEGVEGPTARFAYVRAIVADDVSGVQRVVVHYSTDNKTWQTADAGFISPFNFTAQIQLSKTTDYFYYHVEALSWSGASSSSSPAYLSFTGAPPLKPQEGGTGLDTATYAILVGIVLIFSALYLFLRKRRPLAYA